MGIRKENQELERQLEEAQRELGAERRQYYDLVHGELQNVREEWKYHQTECITMADNLKRQFGMAVKQTKSFAGAAIKSQVAKLSEIHTPADLYATLQPHLDKGGYILGWSAEKVLDTDFYREFITEDTAGMLEDMNGFGKEKLLAAKYFGEYEYTIRGSYELISRYTIHTESDQYKAYQNKLYSHALDGIVSPNIQKPKEMLSALAALEDVQPCEPQQADEWVSFPEHVSRYSDHDYFGETPGDSSDYYTTARINEEIENRLVHCFPEPPGMDDVAQLHTSELPLRQSGLIGTANGIARPQKHREYLLEQLSQTTQQRADTASLSGGAQELITACTEDIERMKGAVQNEGTADPDFEKWLNDGMDKELSKLGCTIPASKDTLWQTFEEYVPENPESGHTLPQNNQVEEYEFVSE